MEKPFGFHLLKRIVAQKRQNFFGTPTVSGLLMGLAIGWAMVQTILWAENAELNHISLPTNAYIQKAEFYYRKPAGEIKAVLVLCPGKNGNGESWINEVKWRDFGADEHLLLCGLWFVSSKDIYSQPDYTDARTASGEMVITALKEMGVEKKPLLLYGFSAGARFTASFVEKYPNRILTFAACAVGEWIPPVKTFHTPPGLIASGEYDGGSYWPSMQYFQEGRALGRQWAWVGIPKVGHQRNL